ncbi:MAG: rhodanese-like domain-containing protein [Gammaproteobacteria bacterium]|jgi:rhodanese-related sulfurtransferase|nr:rhodanese-like domain-containing protein [Gammaproteobacteria bacterium]
MDKFLEFAGNNTLLVSALMVSFFVVIFTELRRKATGMVNIDAVEAVKLINNDAVVVDLRSSDAHARGHIVNARSVPSDELESKLSTLDQYKSKPVIAVCESGVSSTRAVNTMRQQGFESVYGLKGGMTGWSQAGLPVVTGKKTKSKSGKSKKRA